MRGFRGARKLNFTGERYLPEISGAIRAEHVHRYQLARFLASGYDVLDVACGEGYGSNMIAEVARSVAGVDVSAETIAHAQATYRSKSLRFLQGDCAALPCEDATFDLVVSFETIEHHERHNEMLREIRRVLRSGGVLMISSPNRPEYDLTLSEPNPFHVKELDFAEFDALLRAHFPNVALYAQRVIGGSLIAPLSRQAAGYRHFSDEAETDQIPQPIYFVALASDDPLPVLGVSVYEGARGMPLVKPWAEIEARLYISEIEQGSVQRYSQERSTAAQYPVNGQRQTLHLVLPADVLALARVRLDLANQPVAIFLHDLLVETPDGVTLWRWSGGDKLFRNVVDLAFRGIPKGLMVMCLGNDPRFELDIPTEVMARVGPGARLVAEMTPRPLLEVCAEVFSQDDRLISNLRAALSGKLSTDFIAALDDASFRRLSFSLELEDIAALLKNSLARRDQTILQQSVQIKAMRDEILRAEAQLELLKDVMLNSRVEDRL